MPLRILVDALAARRGGTAYAAIELAHALAADSSVESVEVATRRGSIVAEGLRPSRALRPILIGREGRFELPRRLAWETFALPLLVRRTRADFLLTWSGMLPRRLPCPVLSFVSNPVMFESDRGLNRVRRWAMRRTLRSGTGGIVAPTEAMADLVENAFGARPIVVGYGVRLDRFQLAEEPGTGLLCVADFYPHKRHDLVIDAWQALPAPRPTLTFVGNPSVDEACHARTVRLASEVAHLGSVQFLSGLSLDELVRTYQGARAFVLASEAESFCLPLLEAQACGLATVVRNLPALHETGGPATVYVCGDNAVDWARAFNEVLSADPRTVRESARRHAGRFSWLNTAHVVRELMTAGGRGG